MKRTILGEIIWLWKWCKCGEIKFDNMGYGARPNLVVREMNRVMEVSLDTIVMLSSSMNMRLIRREIVLWCVLG